MTTASVFFQAAFVAVSILASSADIAGAIDFGTRGRSYEIEEQAFLEMIDQRLSAVDQNQLRQEMQERAKQRAKEPLPVEGIEQAEEGRVFYFDPSYVLEQDIYLPNRKLFYRAGIRVNPLEEMQKLGMPLNRRMIFIDAREEEQIDWLKAKLAMYRSESDKSSKQEQAPIENRIILVGGRPFDVQEDLQADYEDMFVYFDQGGALTGKLGIRTSPAIVSQEGYMLRIEEFVIEENETKGIKEQKNKRIKTGTGDEY